MHGRTGRFVGTVIATPSSNPSKEGSMDLGKPEKRLSIDRGVELLPAEEPVEAVPVPTPDDVDT
jgi:hypothetical protein